MCQEMEGVPRARVLERSAVNDLSSLISDQRETSHPVGEQEQLPELYHRSLSHFSKVNHSYGCRKYFVGRIKFVFPDLQNNPFPSNIQASSKPTVGSTGKHSLKILF